MHSDVVMGMQQEANVDSTFCSGRDTGVDEQHLLALAPTSKRPRTAEKQKDAQRYGPQFSIPFARVTSLQGRGCLTFDSYWAKQGLLSWQKAVLGSRHRLQLGALQQRSYLGCAEGEARAGRPGLRAAGRVRLPRFCHGRWPGFRQSLSTTRCVSQSLYQHVCKAGI